MGMTLFDNHGVPHELTSANRVAILLVVIVQFVAISLDYCWLSHLHKITKKSPTHSLEDIALANEDAVVLHHHLLPTFYTSFDT